MVIRRAFYYWQFIAALALPAWLLVGAGVFGGGALQMLGLLIIAPILAVAMFAVAGIMSVRKGVRSAHALSWLDVGILTLWHLLIICAGLYTPATGLYAFFGTAMAVVVFWIAVWELISETRNRLAGAMADLQSQAGFVGTSRPPAQPGFDSRKPQNGQTLRLE